MRAWFFALIFAVLAAPASAQVCNYRYAAAADMLMHAFRYGTLYSGGDHFRYLDHPGATLDLYRLWRGLPDLNLRRRDAFDQVETRLDPAVVAERLRAGLKFMSQDAPPGDAAEQFAALVHLDLLTPVSAQPDWWAAPIDAASAPRSAVIAQEAATSEPLQWLLLVAAASDAGWTLDPDSRAADAGREPAFAALSERARARYESGAGLEWLAAAAALAPPASQASAALAPARDALAVEVLACRATPAQYAAWSVMEDFDGFPPDFRKRFAALPPAIANLRLERQLRFAAFDPAFDAGARLDALRASAVPVEALTNAAVAAVYRATNFDAVANAVRSAPWSPYTVRALNVLSAAQLEELSRDPALDARQQADLAGVAFSRYLALELDAQALALLPRLRVLFPEQAGEFDALQDLALPESVRAALIALALPRVSPWLQPDPAVFTRGDFALRVRHARFRHELPRDMLDGAFLEADFETWLQLPNRWYRWRGMHGFELGAVQRRLQRRREHRSFERVPRPSGALRVPLRQWMASDELQRLGEGGYTVALARRLIGCAEDPPFTWRGSDCRGEAMASGLQRLIRQARFEEEPLLDGQPVGRRAFRALQREMPETEAARATRWWFD